KLPYSWLRSAWWIDPYCGWQLWRSGRPTYEALRMSLVRRHQDLSPRRDRLGRLAAMNRGWREQANPTMMMLMVVPLKEGACPSAGIRQTAELGRKARPIFQRLELTFRIRIVVRDMRSRMGLGHAQIGQQLRDTLGRHRAPPIGVQRELVRANPF